MATLYTTASDESSHQRLFYASGKDKAQFAPAFCKNEKRLCNLRRDLTKKKNTIFIYLHYVIVRTDNFQVSKNGKGT